MIKAWFGSAKSFIKILLSLFKYVFATGIPALIKPPLPEVNIILFYPTMR